MSLEVLHNSDSNLLLTSAAKVLLKELKTCAGSGDCIVALPGGRSVVGLLEKLLQSRAVLEREMWQKLHFFMVDERLVPLEDKDSNFKLLNENFFSVLKADGFLGDKQIHPFVFDPSTADSGIGRYQAELESVGGRYDVVVLGVGEDAHVGALFPEHHSIRNKEPFFLTMNDSPKPPPLRMTGSAKLLGNTKVSLALFLGSGKQEALQKFHDSQLSLESCPAKLLLKAERGYLVTDIQNAQ